MRKIVELMFVISFITFVYCANAVDRYWNNTGTDFNDGASWIGGTAPGKMTGRTFMMIWQLSRT